MGRRLFAVGKVPLYVEAVRAALEKRGDIEAKVVTMVFRLGPFDAKFATAIDTGLGGGSNVRHSVFNLNDDDPKDHIEGMMLSLDCPRQRLDIYAAPDVNTSRLCFDQAKIGKLKIRIPKDSASLEARFSVTFGPPTRDELEAAHAAYRTQMFITFEEAEESLAFEGVETTKAPEYVEPVPMWDEGETAAAGAANR